MPWARARWISAMPPTAISWTSEYGPKRRAGIVSVPLERADRRSRVALFRGRLVAGRGLGRRALAELVGVAWVDEDADQPERRLAAALERADHLGRDVVGHVDDVARRRVGDQVQAEARAIGLAIDLAVGRQTLVDVGQDGVLGQAPEAVADRDGQH